MRHKTRLTVRILLRRLLRMFGPSNHNPWLVVNMGVFNSPKRYIKSDE